MDLSQSPYIRGDVFDVSGSSFLEKSSQMLKITLASSEAETVPWSNSRKLCHMEHETKVVPKHYV